MLARAKNILYFVVHWLYKVAVKLSLPRVAGVALALMTKKVNGKGNYRVLCLSRSIFMDDVQSLVNCSDEVQYIYFPLGYLNVVVEKFIKDSNLTESNYHIEPKYYKTKEQMYLFVAVIYTVLSKILKTDAVMSCNFGYIPQQELFRASRQLGIPVIILYKEGLAISAHLGRFGSIYKNHHALIDKMLCYNKSITNTLIAQNIAGISKQNCVSVGIPRFDSYYTTSTIKPKRQIVLFSFYPRDKFFYFVDDTKITQKVAQAADGFHRLVMQFARNHPDYQVVIKTKVAKHYLDYVNNIYQVAYGSVKMDNLTITNVASAYQLIVDSVAILGLNSTTLIEGIIAKKIVISPDLRMIFGNEPWDYFSDYPEVINYASTYAQLEECIASQSCATITPERRRGFVESYIHKDDGQASLRATSEIIKTIQKSQEKVA